MLQEENPFLLNKLYDMLTAHVSDVYFVHSDIRNALYVNRPEPFSTEVFLLQHLKALQELFKGADIWMPVFNYDFPVSQLFDIHSTVSKVGHLTEYFRTHHATWRTPVPIFSITGTGTMPILPNTHPIDPFGSQSVFKTLCDRKGVVFFYGCTIQSFTLIHYAESCVSNLLYRYRKSFYGTMVSQEKVEQSVVVEFHVRPYNKKLVYDWNKLQNDLQVYGIMRTVEDDGRNFSCIAAEPFVEFCTQKMQSDPYYLLTKETKEWVEPMIQKLGRGFLLCDFESDRL